MRTSAANRITALTSCRYTLDNHYWYQIIVDELPVWGMVGEVSDDAADKGAPSLSVLSARPLCFGIRVRAAK